MRTEDRVPDDKLRYPSYAFIDAEYMKLDLNPHLKHANLSLLVYRTFSTSKAPAKQKVSLNFESSFHEETFVAPVLVYYAD